MTLSQDQLHSLTLKDYKDSVGKVFIASDILSFYENGDILSFWIPDGVRVRILDNASEYDICPPLDGGWVDPYWPVDILDQREEFDGHTNFHVIPRRFSEDGEVAGEDCLLPTF